MMRREKKLKRKIPGSGAAFSYTVVSVRKWLVMAFFILFLSATFLTGIGRAAISDRVVAFVDDHAITMSELEEHYRSTAAVSPLITREEVLDTMINRILLLREARKFRIEASSADEVVHEYIDLKIRAFIRVSESEIEKFYLENRAEFGGKELDDVRDEIDAYLTEKSLNMRLKELVAKLRAEAYIKTFFEKER